MVDATPKSPHHQHTNCHDPKHQNWCSKTKRAELPMHIPCHRMKVGEMPTIPYKASYIQKFGNFSKQVILGYWSKHIWASNTGTLGRAIHARATDQLLNSATRSQYTLEAKTCTGQFSAWQLSVNKEWKTAKHAQGMINSLHAETPLSTAWCSQINLRATFRVHFHRPWVTDWPKP